MRSFYGSHIYINIANFNEIIEREEKKTKNVIHSLHALDTYFRSIECVGRKYFGNEFVAEKITNSRLHLVIQGELSEIKGNNVLQLAGFAYILAMLFTHIGKYNSLDQFEIQIGCDYGKVRWFEFSAGEYREETSIGFSANYAAKLQSTSSLNTIRLSEDVYNCLPENTLKLFEKISDERLKKYTDSPCYTATLSSCADLFSYTSESELAHEIAENVNLEDIQMRSINSQLRFERLSKTSCVKFDGVAVMADVRGSTQKFKDDDSNIDQMAELLKNILLTMYTTMTEKGTHVQFQGDKEFAVFNKTETRNCAKDTVIASLKLLDRIPTLTVQIGEGQAYGTMFASKIGANGERDNVIIGSVVNRADENEDLRAEEHQLVIDRNTYLFIQTNDPILASLFSSKDQYTWYTEAGYKDYLSKVQTENFRKSTESRSYNGAWNR